MELAVKGKGLVSPNPMVGCVLVKDNAVIGEGYHHVFGGPHAEVEAVNSVQNKQDIQGATAYVSLEPCAHFGRTPPCANLLVDCKVSKVVICNRDPYSEVDGKGIQILRKAGIDVVTGVCEAEGRELNKAFFTFHEKKRPYVVLKWAQSTDGFIAPENQATGQSFLISSDLSNQRSHQLRAELDAILVGRNTFEKDLPQLTNRHYFGNSPVKIILDSELKALPQIKDAYSNIGRTIVFNQNINQATENGIELILCDMRASSILDILFAKKIQSVLIEGGQNVLQHFIDENLWDEAHVITGKVSIHSGVAAPALTNFSRRETINYFTDQITHYHA